jgi:rod shape-determining protein MreC
MLPRGSGGSRFTIALLAVISVSVLALDLLGAGPLDSIRNGVLGALGPFRSAGEAVFGEDESTELAELRAENDRLVGMEARAANAEAEVAALRQLFGLPLPASIDRVVARVIGGPRSNFDRTLEIDKGASAGIKVGMPVTTGAGLVGQVDRVTFNRSTIRLIDDPLVRPGVLHVPSRDVGVARGGGEGEAVIVDAEIDAETEIAADDLFVTSGVEGSGYPGGLPVGRAIDVRPSGNPLEQEVLLEPIADLQRLTVVQVLLFEPGDPQDGGAEEQAP